MRLVLQRAAWASVSVAGRRVAEAQGRCLVILAGLGPEDDERDIAWCADKALNVKLWPDEEGRDWRKSASDLGVAVLAVSQFTLFARLNGRRPDFSKAMPPDAARSLFADFVHALRAAHARVLPGEFGEHMAVELHNDGPVTIVLDSRENGVTLPPPPKARRVHTAHSADDTHAARGSAVTAPIAADVVRVSIAEAPAGWAGALMLTIACPPPRPVDRKSDLRAGPASWDL